MRKAWMVVLALAFASPVTAQDHAMHQGSPAVDGVRSLYDRVKGWIVASAEKMPEEHFSFQPTPEVRTYGQILGHIANASYMFCSTALGEQAGQRADAEKLATKAELVSALNEAFAYCDRAYAITEAQAMEPSTIFGQQGTKLLVLEFNMAHDFEHYGNLVTYMRMKGLVPPSSAGD